MHAPISKRNVDFARTPGNVPACKDRRRLRRVKAICTVLLLPSLPAVMPAQQVAIGDHPMPIADSRPGEIAAETNVAPWFTGNHGDKIGRVATGGANTEYALASYAGLRGITAVKTPDVPLSFEPNGGQAPAQVRYLTRGNSYTLYLTSREAVLARPNQPALRTQLVGANLSARIVGEGQQASTSNYFIGNDPSRWRASVPNYGRVRYVDLYPGIDLVYHGRGGNVEYDWIVSPGSDPQKIRLSFAGPNRVRIDSRGDLVITQGKSEYRHRKPAVCQEIAGKRIQVAGTWVLHGKEAGFRVGAYDRAQTLVIDPPLIYSSYLGGSGLDYGYAVAVDNVGNTYLTGSAGSTDFPTTAPLQNSLRGTTDVFVTKINATGTAKLYSTYLGGGGPDVGYGIAVDSDGNAYVTGSAGSFDFPMKGAIQGTWGGSGDVFLTKINALGSALVYSTYLGGGAIDYGTAIALDPSGNAYITGITFSTNFPTVNPYQAVKGAQQDAFVAKINPGGTAWVYSTYLGGNNVDQGFGIAADASGNTYVTGYTAATNFPLQSPYRSSNAATVDAFVTKLNSAGSALVYSTYLGGSGTDYANAIAVDSSGSAYVTGIVGSNDFPAVNAMQPHIGGGTEDSFVTKFDPSGSTLMYSTYLGGGSTDDAYAVAVDQAGDAYVTGRTNSSDFPLTSPLQSIRTAFDMFITELNPAGSARLFSTFLGGKGDESGRGIAIDRRGNVHIAGESSSTDFPVLNAFQPANGGGAGPQDALVLSLGNSSWAVTIPSDFNNDGHPDVIWEDPTSGFAQVWYLGGTQGVTVTGSANLTQTNPWQIVAVADFDGNGAPDVVWQDPASGAVQVWYLGGPLGNVLLSAANITSKNAWRVVSVADFNHDAHPDLLWEDPASGFSQIWYLGGSNGITLLGASNLTQKNSWQIVGCGDFNGDGFPDVLWQDPKSGTVQIWYMGGTTPGHEGSVLQSAKNLTANSWRVVAIADFNQDGHPDVVFQSPANGAAQVFYYTGAQGTTYSGSAVLSSANPWYIAGPK